jgi:hypothetical protein
MHKRRGLEILVLGIILTFAKYIKTEKQTERNRELLN